MYMHEELIEVRRWDAAVNKCSRVGVQEEMQTKELVVNNILVYIVGFVLSK